MKRSNRLVILVGVLLAVLAFVGIVVLLNQTGGPSQEEEPTTVTVLVATEDIAIGDPVTPEVVEEQEVDPDEVVGTRIGSTTQVSGQRALYDIPAGSQIPAEAIGLGQTGTVCIECQLNPGEKAIAFQVDRVTGLDFLIQPGDHIDIVVSQQLQVVQPTQESLEDPTGPQRFETIPGLENARTVKTILQDKRVLYVSATRIRQTAVQQTPSPGQQGQQPQQAQQIENVIIVFAGTDQDAEVIKFAQNDVSTTGPLTAVLRSTDDTDVEVTTGITIDLLVETYGLPIPDIIANLGEEAAPQQ
ncbi:MAG TPA: Flp pilus assembly protein CpaB [candidate division Zixibacteria bacterium]|nr:Flp pilus assembly protein CpaB [candidate division Zixibacteria bacterium]